MMNVSETLTGTAIVYVSLSLENKGNSTISDEAKLHTISDRISSLDTFKNSSPE